MEQFGNNSVMSPEKTKVLKVMFVVLVLLAIFLGAETINALKENRFIGSGVIATNVINVSGKGEVLAIPDTGSFSFSVIEEGKTVKEAQDKASKKINTSIDTLKGLGITEKDIKTTGYNSYPKYDYTTYPCVQPMMESSGSGISSVSYPCRPGKNILTGYEVSQTVSVKIRKTADSGEILTKVGGFGVANISSLDFVIDDMDKVLAEARDLAIIDAKNKAKVLAKSLGVKLQKIVNFQESGSQPPIYYGMAQSKAEDASSVIPQIPVGEDKVVSNVTLTYEIE